MKCPRPRWALLSITVLACLVVGTMTASAATSSSHSATGTLSLQAELRLESTPGPCPPAVDANTCAARTAAGLVPGLGRMTQSSTWLAGMEPPWCRLSMGKALAHSVRLAVAGKGEILLELQEATDCIDQEPVRNQAQAFTITGGTGSFSGASGSGTVERTLEAQTSTGRVGRETWKSTLTVPGFEFDVTRPTLTGAANKTVTAKRGAKSARATFGVTAQDNRDGSLPVMCTPRSGTRFPIGRTKVTCSATDSSANTAAANFTITVKRPR